MENSSPAQRAKRILGWQTNRGLWTGSWDFYDTPSFEGDLTPIQVNDPLLLPPFLKPVELTELFPGIVLACFINSCLLPPPKHQTEEGEPLYSRDDVYRSLDMLLNGEALVSGATCAKFLDIPVSSLRDYSARGIVPYVQVGKHRKYQLRQVMQKLQNDYKSAGVGRIEALKDLLR